jgi:hypothetical protein
MMAWWKGTPDNDGNWERDIAELAQSLSLPPSPFEVALSERWKKVFQAKAAKPSVIEQILKGEIIKITD